LQAAHSALYTFHTTTATQTKAVNNFAFQCAPDDIMEGCAAAHTLSGLSARAKFVCVVVSGDIFQNMAKELIVSVNGREKKIAIIENDQVTEFYIERGEENQGIVGNIYKGRVQRVLPGMQSAFVDIGLERDAFLYVSDFFDEEEEFERIVVDKSKSVTGSAAEVRAAAERAANERIEQARIEREHRIEATQERAEPLLDAEPINALDNISAAVPFVEDEVSSAGESPVRAGGIVENQQSASAAETEGGRRGRRRRGRPQYQTNQSNDVDAREPLRAAGSGSTRFSAANEVQTPFAIGESSFERVIDSEETAAEDGSMLKDAMLQERLMDQIHAVEFDMESAPTAEVGSLLAASANSLDASFQRIDDSDVTFEEKERRQSDAFVQQTIAAHVEAFVDEINDETIDNDAQTFERVSDDAINGQATALSQSEQGAAEEESGARSSSSSSNSGRSRRAAKLPAEAAATSPTKRARAAKSSSATKGSARKGAAASRADSATTKERPPRHTGKKSSDARSTATALEADELNFAGTASNDVKGDTLLEDSEARLSTKASRGEFATRRGGRRRRRPNGKPQEQEAGAAEVDRSNGKASVEAESIVEVEEAPLAESLEVVAPSSAPPARERSRHERPKREERPAAGRTGGHQSDTRGVESNQRRGGGGGRQHPTIADLLREGQEVLVQIAKEPIAKKGARITSHIALPGRFLVYMPTVEHVGVSRKIESDSERARLRKLIAAIRNEENVPSGGFIVRTAGIGISEEDLRDDARYLVRTWLDIRKSAEKVKAPTPVHRDLDLVQRLLRDQLSDDFTAIRVDSEEEYLRIVEFVNRIQPRMVKRVKLYTRDEPILEAYGVQTEIDKAIKPRVWLKSGGYLVINQTEALVAIDVNTGKFVGRGGSRLEDTITKTNLEAVDEIVRQIRLRDLGGIIVLDLIDMEDRRNRNRVMQALQEALQDDKSPTKVLSFNDFGLVIMTRKRVKQSLERTLCAPCPYCAGAGLVKSPQTVCYEILDEARRLSKGLNGDAVKQTTLRINPEVARALRSTERDVLTEIEDYLGAVDITSDAHIHQEQYDFAFV
jgi:ribonuclease G